MLCQKLLVYVSKCHQCLYFSFFPSWNCWCVFYWPNTSQPHTHTHTPCDCFLVMERNSPCKYCSCLSWPIYKVCECVCTWLVGSFGSKSCHSTRSRVMDGSCRSVDVRRSSRPSLFPREKRRICQFKDRQGEVYCVNIIFDTFLKIKSYIFWITVTLLVCSVFKYYSSRS